MKYEQCANCRRADALCFAVGRFIYSDRLSSANFKQFKSQTRQNVKKWIYFFGAGKAEGEGTWKDLLGGKGSGLAEMTRIGLPVPAGFTISTEACDYYYKKG